MTAPPNMKDIYDTVIEHKGLRGTLPEKLLGYENFLKSYFVDTEVCFPRNSYVSS